MFTYVCVLVCQHRSGDTRNILKLNQSFYSLLSHANGLGYSFIFPLQLSLFLIVSVRLTALISSSNNPHLLLWSTPFPVFPSTLISPIFSSKFFFSTQVILILFFLIYPIVFVTLKLPHIYSLLFLSNHSHTGWHRQIYFGNFYFIYFFF